MSVICKEASEVGAPAVPCKDDIALNMLKELFGDRFIESFYVSGTPHPALVEATDGGANMMSLIAQNLSSAALIATLLIIIFSVYKGLISGANDGVAVAFTEKSSLMGLFGRPLFSLAMLMPTVSGYPVIYLLIVLITLTSNGLTNEGFEKYIGLDYNTSDKGSSAVARLNDPNYLASNDMLKPAFYGALHGFCVSYANYELDGKMRQVRKDSYQISGNAGTSYSTRSQAKDALEGSRLSGYSSEATLVNNYSFYYKDVSKSKLDNVIDGIGNAGRKLFGFGVTGIPTDACGKFIVKLNPVQVSRLPEGALDDEVRVQTNRLINSIREMGTIIAQRRAEHAQIAYYEGFASASKPDLEEPGTRLPVLYEDEDADEVVTTPQGFCSGRCNLSPSWIGANGWEADSENYGPDGIATNKRPNIERIVNISKKETKALNTEIESLLLSRGFGFRNTEGEIIPAPGSTFKDTMQFIVDGTVAQGWMAAGTYRARLQKFRKAIQESLRSSPVTISFTNISGEGLADDIKVFVQTLSTVRTQLYNQINSSSEVPVYSELTTEASIGQFDINSKDIGSFSTSFASSFIQTIYDVEEEAISIMTGTAEGDDIDAISRIQMVGESISGLSLFIATLHKIIMVSLAALSMVGAVGAGTTSFVFDVGAAIDALRQLYLETIGTWGMEAVDALFDVSRIFSVVIPTMPYVFLALAAVGWFMQVIQTAFGMPLFFIMHAIPERSFIGNQAQGYVTLVSLAFRPIIILAAFFLSFVIYDPVLTYVTQVYFSIHTEVAGSSQDGDIARFFIIVSTFKYYWFIYGSVLIMVTYLIFGLIQELGDSVLDWLGTNLLRGFGNMDTGGVMKSASQGMAGMAKTSRERKQAIRSKSGGGGGNTGGGNPNGGNPNGGNPNGGNPSGGNPGGGGSNPRARTPSSGGNTLGGTGPAPASPSNTGLNRAGQVGASTLIAGGATVKGAGLGAAQGAYGGMRSGFSTGRRIANGGMAGAALGATLGTAGAATGAAYGAVRGGLGGVRRGFSALGGASSYANTVNKQRASGAYGMVGRGRTLNKMASLNRVGDTMARGGSGVLTPAAFQARAGGTWTGTTPRDDTNYSPVTQGTPVNIRRPMVRRMAGARGRRFIVTGANLNSNRAGTNFVRRSL